MPVSEIDLSTIKDEVAREGLLKEANAGRVVPTGVYNLRFRAAKGVSYDGAPPLLSFQADVEKDGSRVTGVFFDVDWRGTHNANGKLTKPSRLFGQLLKALELPDGASNRDVLEAFEGRLVAGFLTETLKSPEGDFIDVGEDRKERDGKLKQVSRKEAEDLVAAGWEAKNYLQTISKVKA